MSWSPSSNEEDTIGVWLHNDMDLEVILRWYAFAYLCTLLGCFQVVPQVKPRSGDSQQKDIELEGNGALEIHDDSFVIAYL